MTENTQRDALRRPQHCTTASSIAQPKLLPLPSHANNSEEHPLGEPESVLSLDERHLLRLRCTPPHRGKCDAEHSSDLGGTREHQAMLEQNHSNEGNNMACRITAHEIIHGSVIFIYSPI